MPSTATNITVCPSRRSVSARARERRRRSPQLVAAARRCRAPTRRPSTMPTTPLPGARLRTRLTGGAAMPRRRARRRRSRPASGCSLPRSRLAASAQQLGLGRTPASRDDRRSRGLPSVSVPVLSTTSVSTCSSTLERFGVLEQHAGVAPRPVADHDRHRRRQAERARARDDQHRDGVDERVRQTRLGPDDAPDDERQHGDDRDDRRHELAGDAVGQPLDRRAAALRLGDHAHDLREQRVARRRARRA